MALHDIKPFKDLVEGLIGRDVEFALGPMVEPEGRNTVGVYVNPSNVMSAIVLLDRPLTAYLGGALGLVPIGIIEESLADGLVPENLQENTGEVLNVLAAVLGEVLGVHQRLDVIYPPTEGLPGNVNSFAGDATMSRLDLTLDVAGYGSGHMSVVGFEQHPA
jgi:hypothetical protein